MALPNIGEYISGGYLIVKPAPRPKDFSELLPRTLITVSSCFADIAPDLWAVDWDNYSTEDIAEEAGKFGIPAHLGAELVRWTSAEMKTSGQHPNAFLTLEMAREFWRRFVNNNEVLLIGIGLHTSLLPSLYGQLEKDANRGYGLLERIERKEALAPGGLLLGYEPLGYDATNFHSWLCHAGCDEGRKLFGVRPNENGLIPSLETGIQTTEYLVQTGAEQAIWEPWLLVKYEVECPT